MKASTRLGLEISSLRQKLNELNAKEELTAEDRATMETLTTRYSEAEVELRSAMAGEETDEVTERETVDSLTELRSKASVAEIVSGFLEQRTIDGATAEYLQELKLPQGTIPLELIVEKRAATPSPTEVGVDERPYIPAVFPNGATAFLGIPQETQASGEALYTVMTSRAAASTPAAGASVAESTGAFSVTTLSPKRIQAAFEYRIEDRARFGQLDMALRNQLNEALSEGLDKAILTRAATGLFNSVTQVATAAEETYSSYRELLAARVDGRLAMGTGDVRMLVGASTFEHMDAEYRTDTAGDDQSALDFWRSRSGGVRVSYHVPAVTAKKQDALLRIGGRRDSVAVLWQGITLINDNITKADTGVVILTACMLYDFSLLRQDGFIRQSLQVEA